MTEENRKWAVEQALKVPNRDPLKLAAEIYGFVTGNDQSRSNPKETEVYPRTEKVVPWSPKKLTEAQQAVMLAVLHRHNTGQNINGVVVAKDLGVTAGNVSVHLKNLVILDYVSRKGNTFMPKRTVNGNLLPLQVTKCPTRPVRGYSSAPLTAPMAHHAVR